MHQFMHKRPGGRKFQGGWLNFVIQAATAIGGAVLAKRGQDKAVDQANADREAELRLEQQRLDLANRQDERSQMLFDQYQQTWAPRERELLEEAFNEPLTPDNEEAKATADVRSALESARGMSERNLRRHGVNPASGAFAGLDRMRNLEGAKIESGARTRARQGVEDRNFARKSSVVGLGRGLPTAASSFAGQAGAGYAGAAGLAAGRADASNRLAQHAGANYGAALGDAVGTLADTVSDWWKNRKPAAGADVNRPTGFEEERWGY